MIKHEISKQKDATIRLVISVDSDFINPIKAKTLAELKKDLKVSGFRPGKMPDAIAERNLGENYVQSHVAEAVVMQAYSQAVIAEKIETIDAPQIQLKKFVPYSELEFEATAPIMPSIKLDPKNLIVPEPEIKIAQSEVQTALDNLATQMAKRTASDGSAKSGDEVKIDFEGVRDGQLVEGAAAKNQTIKIGENKFIPGFEDNLVGLKKGDEKSFELTFPKNYGHKDLAGAKVTFKVKIHEVTKVELPKLDDKFAQSVGGFKTLSDLKADIKKSLEASKADQQRKDYEDKVLANAVNKVEFTAPASLVQQQIDRLNQEVNNNLSASGLTLEQYLKIQGKTKEEVDKEIKDEANKRVKIAILVRQIVAENKLVVSEEELEENYMQMKAQYTDPKMQQEMNHEHFLDDLKNHLLTTKAIKILLQYARGEKKA